jgi:phosphoserine phosphatase
MQKLNEANTNGKLVIIATASPRIYVSAILDAMQVKRFTVIGTEINFETGEIIGKECSREEKWNAIIQKTKKMNINIVSAYGNLPDDLFLLQRVVHGFIVKGPKIKKI